MTTPCSRNPANWRLHKEGGGIQTMAVLRASIWACEKRCPLLEWCGKQRHEPGTVQAGWILTAAGLRTQNPGDMHKRESQKGKPEVAPEPGKCAECGEALPEERPGNQRFCQYICRIRNNERHRVRPPRTPPQSDATPEAIEDLIAGGRTWDAAGRWVREGAVVELHSRGLYDTEIGATLGASPTTVRGIRKRLKLTPQPRSRVSSVARSVN